MDWLSVAHSVGAILCQGASVAEEWERIDAEPASSDATKLIFASVIFHLCAQGVGIQVGEAASADQDHAVVADTGALSGCTAPARYVATLLQEVSEGLRPMDWFILFAGGALEHVGEVVAELRPLQLDKALTAELRKAEPILFAERERYRKRSARAIERKIDYRKGHPDVYRKDDPSIGRRTVSDAATPMLHVNLFGGMEVRIGSDPVEAKLLSRKKTKSALALLVINRGREVSRDRIAQMLWPHSGVDAYKRNFYGIWSQLKKALSVNGKCPYLIRTQSGCRIDSRFLVSDIVAFEELCRSLLFGSENPVAWERLYAQVNEDFADDFMPYETENPHIIYLRERYREQLSDGLIATSTRLNSLNEPRGALWFAKEALRRNDKREDAYIALMEAQIASNQRGAALETYFTCRRFLSDELGIDPSTRVVELYRSIIEVEEKI